MGAVVALALSSCAYDPNSYAVGGSYSTGYGYGDGYGYGNSGFSTSMFVSTGDPRWGYDPYCYSYYDYTRRCYYDPYLYGYYPMGYRPVVVVGVPHPHGYNRSHCPPPSRVRNYNLANYHNRESAYRNTSYSWARQVRQDGGNVRGQPHQTPYSRAGSSNYSGNRNLAPAPGGYPRTHSGSTLNKRVDNPPVHRQSGLPSNYNVPIRTSPQGNASQPMTSGHSRSNLSQGAPQMRTSGPTPQPRAERQGPPVQRSSSPPPNTKVRGLGEGNEGREGRGDNQGWGRSRR